MIIMRLIIPTENIRTEQYLIIRRIVTEHASIAVPTGKTVGTARSSNQNTMVASHI